MRIVTSAFAVWIRFVVALKNACDSKAVCELILELGCGNCDELSGTVAPDSPEAMPGSALHRLGKARRNNARRERGARRRMRLKSIYTHVSTIKFDDAGDCRARRGAARPSFNEPVKSKQTCPPPVF